MKLQRIQFFSQGVVQEQTVPLDIADQVIRKLTRSGYTVWKVATPHPY